MAVIFPFFCLVLALLQFDVYILIQFICALHCEMLLTSRVNFQMTMRHYVYRKWWRQFSWSILWWAIFTIRRAIWVMMQIILQEHRSMIWLWFCSSHLKFRIICKSLVVMEIQQIKSDTACWIISCVCVFFLLMSTSYETFRWNVWKKT